MVNTRRLVLTFFASTALEACGGTPEQGTVGGVTQWLGESTHLALSGSYMGTSVDVHLEGDAAKDVYCHRFYAPMDGAQPDAMGNYDSSQVYFAFKELGGVINWGGQPKEFTISYWRHDVTAGTDLTVIPRIFGTSVPEGQTWSDINVFDPGADLLSGIESAAASGQVSLKLNSGTPDQNGIMVPAGGRTGEFVAVTWGPHDYLNISSTADCSLVLVVPWATNLIRP